MPSGAMVLVATVPTVFEAQLLAARLGAEGLLWQLRGNVGGPYPVGPVHVLVAEGDLRAAQELLLADEVEASFDGLAEREGDDDRGATGPAAWARRRRGRAALAGGAALVAVVLSGRLVLEALTWSEPARPAPAGPAVTTPVVTAD